METLFLMSASICTCLKEQYLMLCMPINTEQWHAGIGTFHGRIFFVLSKRTCCDPVIIFFYNESQKQ